MQNALFFCIVHLILKKKKKKTSSGLDHAPFCRHHQLVGVWGLRVAVLLVVSDAIMTGANRMTMQSKTLTQYYRSVALMKLSECDHCCDLLL